MIYFNQYLVVRAIKEALDHLDIANDISRIAILLSSPLTEETLMKARQLDHELVEKYPTIETLFALAATMPQINLIASNQPLYTNNNPIEIKNLIQDYYGILADVLIKKGAIQRAEQFIDHVTV